MLMRFLVSALIIVSAIGCFGEKTSKFVAGQCIMPVDGSRVWKIRKTDGDKVVADLISNSFVPVKNETLDMDRHYVAVDCSGK